MRWRALVLALTLAASASAQDTPSVGVLERVVAVVGEQPIFLSDLRARVRLLVHDVAAPTRAAAAAKAQGEALDQLVDEMLLANAADDQRIVTTRDDVQAALERHAAAQHLSVAELLQNARSHGQDEAAYRAQIRRALREELLLAAMKHDRATLLQALRKTSYVEKHP